MRRRSLSNTRATKALLLFLRLGMAIQVLVGLWLIMASVVRGWTILVTLLGVAVVLTYPIIWAQLVTVPLLLGRLLIVNPQQQRLIARSKQVFGSHTAVKIAVAGSYGKTTMKEILVAVLSQARNVAATPGNRNVASSHAVFAAGLTGEEEILIVELGEGKPGDIVKFSETIQPDIAVITGIAPAHLDTYKTIEAAAADIFTITDFVEAENVYVNGDSRQAQQYINPGQIVYSRHGVGDWKVCDLIVSGEKTTFTLQNDKEKIVLESGLLGEHLVGPLAAAAVLALKLGLTTEQVRAGVAATQPHEHRMQSKYIHGALVIDDTYNGNVEGVRAGLELLKNLHSKRKLYVTPGLVEQGPETQSVHLEIGNLIAAAKPDKVVLMKNSVTRYIQQGLQNGGYTGIVTVEENPLEFYTNLDQFVAVGDVVLMQNDWTDNYS